MVSESWCDQYAGSCRWLARVEVRKQAQNRQGLFLYCITSSAIDNSVGVNPLTPERQPMPWPQIQSTPQVEIRNCYSVRGIQCKERRDVCTGQACPQYTRGGWWGRPPASSLWRESEESPLALIIEIWRGFVCPPVLVLWYISQQVDIAMRVIRGRVHHSKFSLFLFLFQKKAVRSNVLLHLYSQIFCVFVVAWCWRVWFPFLL